MLTLVKAGQVIRRRYTVAERPPTDEGFIIDGYQYSNTTPKENLISNHPAPVIYLKNRAGSYKRAFTPGNTLIQYKAQPVVYLYVPAQEMYGNEQLFRAGHF